MSPELFPGNGQFASAACQPLGPSTLGLWIISLGLVFIVFPALKYLINMFILPETKPQQLPEPKSEPKPDPSSCKVEQAKRRDLGNDDGDLDSDSLTSTTSGVLVSVAVSCTTEQRNQHGSSRHGDSSTRNTAASTASLQPAPVAITCEPKQHERLDGHDSDDDPATPEQTHAANDDDNEHQSIGFVALQDLNIEFQNPEQQHARISAMQEPEEAKESEANLSLLEKSSTPFPYENASTFSAVQCFSDPPSP